ncbi:methylenetetrahydrofolate reductase [Hyphomicrobiales bacterium]|nr:methylenetetrahydrofolate reductase [Hyphomicrobiales bacterium]
MMEITVKNNNKELKYSLEIFPPKTVKEVDSLIKKLKSMNSQPEFISVTYGAGGSTQNATLDLVTCLHKETNIDVAAHLTCVNSSIDDVIGLVELYGKVGIKKIVALRGDPPEGLGVPYRPYKSGFKNTADLVRNIKKVNDFDIYVAGYPEMHPESLDKKRDLDTLESKVKAGAHSIITQFFFDNELYYDYIKTLKKRNITIPIIPGIIPIINFNQIKKFSDKCGASIPKDISYDFLNSSGADISDYNLCKKIIIKQITDLINNGVKNFHLYSLNRIQLMGSIWDDVLNQNL